MARTLFPRTIEGCHSLIASQEKKIKRLESDHNAMSEALHKMSNECAVILADKDRQLIEKCKLCQRGIR